MGPLVAAGPRGKDQPRQTGQASRLQHKAFLGTLKTVAAWSPGLTFHCKGGLHLSGLGCFSLVLCVQRFTGPAEGKKDKTNLTY